jgi:hypothetical protein
MAEVAAEDSLPLPDRSEDRWAHLLDRVERGTFLPPAFYREPGREYGCGQIYDDFGRCSARYHGATCMQADSAAAAVGGGESTGAWVRTLRRGAQVTTAAVLANETVEDLLGPEGPADTETLQKMRKILGITGKADLPDRPDPSIYSTLTETMGLA